MRARLMLAAAAPLLAATALVARPSAAQTAPGAAPPAGSPAVAPSGDPGGLQLVPADAAAVLRADPVELERAAELFRRLGGEFGRAANLASLAGASSLGFDPLARAGWRSSGLDGEGPVLLALGHLDPTEPLARWHVRLIARVAQPDQFAGWAAHIPLTGGLWQADHPVRGGLARTVGLDGDARAEADLARVLVAQGTVSVGAVPALGALLFARRSGPFAVLDLFAPAGPGRIGWTRDRDWILTRLPFPASGDALVDRTDAGTRALTQPGLVFWAGPGGLLDALLVWKRPPAACFMLRDLAAHTTLGEAAATLRVTSGHIVLDLVWGTASGAPLGHIFATADDGLIGLPLEKGTILGASLYFGSTARLRTLSRPALIQEGWVPFWRRLRTCGHSVRAFIVAFAWPELAAQWLGEVAAVSPPAGRLVGAIRNFGFAARRVSASDRHGWQAVVESSLAPEGQAAARAVVNAIFGRGTSLRRPRPHTAWAGVFLRPYTLPRGKRGTVLGVAMGRDSRRWRMTQPVGRPRRRPGKGVLARVAGDAAALLRQLDPGLSPRLRALAAAAEPRVGSFESSLIVRPDAIRASLAVRRR